MTSIVGRAFWVPTIPSIEPYIYNGIWEIPEKASLNANVVSNGNRKKLIRKFELSRPI